MSAGDIFLGLLAIIFPPIAVWVKSGICSCDSLINILLCMLGYLPGLIHAWYIISVYPEEYVDYEPVPDSERGGITHHHIYVVNGSAQQQGGRGYGTQQSSGAPPSVPNATRPQQQQGGGGGEGSNGTTARPPPTYAEAVKGDYKIQTQD